MRILKVISLLLDYPTETLVAGRFVQPDQFTARRGAVEVPEGLLEVTLAMSQEQFIGGVPVPGNTVALIAVPEPGAGLSLICGLGILLGFGRGSRRRR